MIPDQPLVSIITPVFNGAKYIEELILSVNDQDYPSIEHIIIDDGSDDGGATVAILKKHTHLHWWSRDNRGQFETMNEGLGAARGEYICIINADDVMLPGAVQMIVAFLKKHPDLDGIAGLTQFMDQSGEPLPNKYPFRNAPLCFYAYFSHVSHCSLYVKRSRLLENNLLFDTSLQYVSDYDWILRILGKLKLTQVRLSLSKVRIHAEQKSTRQKMAMGEELARVVRRHQINPLAYKFLTGIYIIRHDIEKLFFAFRQNGLKGSWNLIRSHLQR